MKKRILLFFILIYSLISRLWMIHSVPPLLSASVFSFRLISVILSVMSVFLLFFYAKNVFRNNRIALLTSWVFTALPWVIEQGRMASQPSNALFFLLVVLLFIQKTPFLLSKIIAYLAIPFGFYIFYPQLWLFRLNQPLPKIFDFLNNLFILTSSELLFFKNITFWWGGVRESGIIYLSLLPFFLIGIYFLIVNFKIEIIIWLIFLILLSAVNPFFPESREFFLAMPFVSTIIALGISQLFCHKGILGKIFAYFIFLFLIYEISQFLHYYMIHYPQQILNNRQKIDAAF